VLTSSPRLASPIKLGLALSRAPVPTGPVPLPRLDVLAHVEVRPEVNVPEDSLEQFRPRPKRFNPF
jgi:hypothetical protein